VTCMLGKSRSQASAAGPVQKCAETVRFHFATPIFAMAKDIAGMCHDVGSAINLLLVCCLFVGFYSFMTVLWRNQCLHCVQWNQTIWIFVCCLFCAVSGQRSQEIMLGRIDGVWS